jgi:cytochrome oxidase Cu insertion factor (SCO1/SenC/PrrC family)
MSRKFWIFVIMLLILTAIYPVAVYLSVQKYEDWKRAQLEILPPQIARIADFDRYGRETTLLIFLVGPVLAICWIVLFLIWGKKTGYFSGVS